MKTLDANGFNSSSVELIKSFFHSRLNRVKINDHVSEWRIMECGCPQGSSFGPLFWNMFQNDMAFHIPDSNLTLYEELLTRAKLPTLHNRCLQDIAILTYKVKNDLVPSYISEIFTGKGSRYNLRNSHFEIPRFNTIRYGKHTLRYQGRYIWSKLENSMRELPSLSIFKTNIRRVDLASLVEDSGNCCNLCST